MNRASSLLNTHELNSVATFPETCLWWKLRDLSIAERGPRPGGQAFLHTGETVYLEEGGRPRRTRTSGGESETRGEAVVASG